MLLLLAALALAAPPPPAPEMRGLWVVRTGLTSPAAVEAVVDDAVRGGFNALFTQVRGRGDAFYASSLAPRSLLLARQPRSFDPLAHLLARARARGLAVHAWINVLLVAGFGGPLPPGHPLLRHPEWMMVPREAAAAALVSPPARLRALVERTRGVDVEGFYLSPAHPGVVAHLDGVVRELLRHYPVDGLHLDFIRYPSASYDYSPAALRSFAGGRGGDLIGRAAGAPEAFDAHRRSLLDGLVARLSRSARAVRPGILVSAAVVPDPALALNHKWQDWPTWAARGWVDAVCPMAYTPDTGLFRVQVAEARARAGGVPVWAGVGAWRLETSGVVAKIDAARDGGAAGIMVFSHESLGDQDLPTLRAVFENGARAVGAAAGAPSR